SQGHGEGQGVGSRSPDTAPGPQRGADAPAPQGSRPRMLGVAVHAPLPNGHRDRVQGQGVATVDASNASLWCSACSRWVAFRRSHAVRSPSPLRCRISRRSVRPRSEGFTHLLHKSLGEGAVHDAGCREGSRRLAEEPVPPARPVEVQSLAVEQLVAPMNGNARPQAALLQLGLFRIDGERVDRQAHTGGSPAPPSNGRARSRRGCSCLLVRPSLGRRLADSFCELGVAASGRRDPLRSRRALARLATTRPLIPPPGPLALRPPAPPLLIPPRHHPPRTAAAPPPPSWRHDAGRGGVSQAGRRSTRRRAPKSEDARYRADSTATERTGSRTMWL